MLSKLANGSISEAEYFGYVNSTSYDGRLRCAAVVDQIHYTKFDPGCVWSHASVSAKDSVTPKYKRKRAVRPEKN